MSDEKLEIVTLWMGKPVAKLSKEQLVEALEQIARDDEVRRFYSNLMRDPTADPFDLPEQPARGLV